MQHDEFVSFLNDMYFVVASSLEEKAKQSSLEFSVKVITQPTNVFLINGVFL